MGNSLLKVIFPVLVAIMAAIGIGANYMDGNTNAAWANFSALCGWLIVVGFNIVDYLEKRPYSV
jgi:Mn2+/Fe2+ NRAMP family transporter